MKHISQSNQQGEIKEKIKFIGHFNGNNYPLSNIEGTKEKRICPLCKGLGHVIKKRNYYSTKQRIIARKLYASGMTLREIGIKIGIEGKNHPQKVKSMIMSNL